MEYSKCPLKKRPIFVIKEDIEESNYENEDSPIDLTIKRTILSSRINTFTQMKSEKPLNFSNRLETINEEDYQNYNEFQTNIITPQDLSSKEYNNNILENNDNFKLKNNFNEIQYPDTTSINLNRNFNNNFITTNQNKYELNYSKMLRTSPVSPINNNIDYNESQYRMEIDEDPDQPKDLSIKLTNDIKPTVLSIRNPNVIIDSNKTNLYNTSYTTSQNDSYYRCNTCTKCYSTLNGLIKHQQTHITNNEKNYINVIENTEEINTFISGSNNNNFINNYNDADNSNYQQRVVNIHRYQCKDCGKSYSTCSGLTKHQQFHCPNSEGNQVKKVFSCKNCDKVYVSLGALKMHIRTHTLPCKCPQCGKAFSRPWLLQGHIRTHTGEKPFSCQHCNRAFADRSNLRAHLQTHSDVKKYSCASCTKTFSRMSLLGKHLQSGCPGVLKPNSSSESTDENSSNSFQNHNDYVENVNNNNNNNNNTYNNNNNSNNNNNDSNMMYDDQDLNNKEMNTGNIQYFSSVIKGPINYDNGHQNYPQVFESY